MSDYPHNMTLRPLDAWPGPVTADRKAAPFEASWGSTMETLDREVRALGQHGLRSVGRMYYYPRTVLQIALREQDFRVSDGLPKANAPQPSHPGVILTIYPDNKPVMSFPCDTFTRWQDNLRGIALGLEALRKLDRYGITQTGQQYRGWQAIEARPATALFTVDTAEAFIRSINPAYSLEPLPKVFRRVRGQAHPDRSNDRALWDRIEAAGEVLRAAGKL